MAVCFSLRHCVNHLVFSREALNPLLLTPPHSISTTTFHLCRRIRRIDSPHPHILRKPRFFSCPAAAAAAAAHRTSAVVLPPFSSGAEEKDVLLGFIMGRRKATELAHSVWKKVVSKGDVVVDATCGNGHDTLVLLKLVADESNKGLVYGMDIQNSALEITSSLLDKSVSANERKNVKLFHLCHSKMEDVIPKDTSVRVITLNLGYLPGGDKCIITVPKTTLLALQAAARILARGGLISVVVYVGHPGGRKELETVKSFVSSLPADSWVSCKFEVLNRSNAPMLVLFFKK